jgi:hypothetical protein
MNARVNVARILTAMAQNRWGIHATCIHCGINNKTLAKILRGEMPRRLDAFYRVIDGLKIPIQEALIGGTYQTEKRPGLRLVSGGRQPNQVA